MKGINKVILVGNPGKEPELKNLADGTMVAKMSLATTGTYRNKDGQQITTTQWHTVILWRNLAKLGARYLPRGSHVYVEGRLNYRQYTNAEGYKLQVTDIIAKQLLMLDKKEPLGAESAVQADILPF